MTAAERNKQTYLRAKAAFNARDMDACTACYAPGHRLMSQHRPEHALTIRSFLEQTITAWPDIKIRVEHAVAEGDFVMGRSVATATHTTTLAGAQPTQKKVETTFWDLHRFNDEGLIVETWNLMDRHSIMQQVQALSE